MLDILELGSPSRALTQYLKEKADDYKHPGSSGSRPSPASQARAPQAKDPKQATYTLDMLDIF